MAEVFVLKDFPLQCGEVVREGQLVYQTYGELQSDRSNVILYPTSYGAQHRDIEWLIHPEGILDPTQWFIIIPNMFGNGLSTSPSNSPHRCFSHWDNVHAQKQLLEEVFGIEELALVYGWSMGAQQAYHWGAIFPDRVQRLACICGTAKTTEHNRIFLLSLRHALTADPCWDGEKFTAVPERGFTAFAYIYASWAASQTFYRQRVYTQLGYHSLDDYLERFWQTNYRRRDPHNLLAMLDTWLNCDVSANPIYGGDYVKALGSIQARTLVMPATTDLYFTPEDCLAEAQLIPKAIYQPIASVWGHRAGNPYEHSADADFIRTHVHRLLSEDELCSPKLPMI